MDAEAVTLSADALDALARLGAEGRVLLVVVPTHIDAVTVILREPDPLDAADVHLLKLVRGYNEQHGEPVTSVDLAARLVWSESTVRYRLARLEERGHLCRPRGERSGYSLTSAGLAFLDPESDSHTGRFQHSS